MTDNPSASLSKVTPENLPSDKSRKELEAWAHSNYNRCKSERSYIERQWYINMAFFFGRQNVQLIPTNTATNGFRLYTPQAPPWRVRLVTNKIRPYVRSDLSRLTSQKPTFTVMPANTDDSAIIAAKVGEDLFESFYQNLKIPQTIKQAVLWCLLTGTSFVKDWWDGEATDLLNNQKGTINVEAITPFHLLVPDLREFELESQPFLCHVTAKSPEWVNFHYKDLLSSGKINPSVGAATDILQDSFLNMVGASTAMKNAVLCREYWLKPGVMKAFPNGGMFTLLGDSVVQIYEGWPYNHREYPFSKLDHIPAGKFYSDSTITDLVPLQREYNRTRSQLIEAKNMMAKPRLLAARGTINPQQITSEPGQVILYTPGMTPPTPLQMAPIPGYVMEELKTIQADMDEISGHSEFQRGQNSQNVTSATQMAFLQEQADTKLQHTVESLESVIEKIGRHCLSHVIQFWKAERIVQVVGKDGSYDAQKFKGEDLNGNFDLRVDTGSAMPSSKAGKQAFVVDLMKMQIIPPDKGLEILDMGGLEKVYDEIQVDTKQARRENVRMADGQPEIPANSWDNHQVHIATHNLFRKTQEYELLSEEIKAEFETHVQLHQQLLSGGGPVGAPTMGEGETSSVGGQSLPEVAGGSPASENEPSSPAAQPFGALNG